MSWVNLLADRRQAEQELDILVRNSLEERPEKIGRALVLLQSLQGPEPVKFKR